MWGMEVQRALLVNLCAGEGENQIVVKKGAYLPPQKLRANGKPLKKVRKRYLWGQQIASIPADGEESMLERIYQDHHRHSHLFVHKGKITPSSLEDVNKDPWVRAQWKCDFFGVRKDEQPCSCWEQGSSCPLPWPAQSCCSGSFPWRCGLELLQGSGRYNGGFWISFLLLRYLDYHQLGQIHSVGTFAVIFVLNKLIFRISEVLV